MIGFTKGDWSSPFIQVIEAEIISKILFKSPLSSSLEISAYSSLLITTIKSIHHLWCHICYSSGVSSNFFGNTNSNHSIPFQTTVSFRYPYYAIRVLNTENRLITWCRYSLWIVLYPLGAGLEGLKRFFL